MLGIIISIVATAIVSVLIARWQMKKNQIDHYFINSYDIGKGLTDDFPEFQLHYGNEVLTNDVKVLKGGFINTGRNDIGENGKRTEIKMLLPEGCIVKDVKVFPLERGLVVNQFKCEYEKKNEIVFCIDGLFKSDECFSYSAIIEAPTENKLLYDELKFEHRIKNTKEIQSYYVGLYDSNMDAVTSWIGIAIVLVAFIFGVYFMFNYRIVLINGGLFSLSDFRLSWRKVLFVFMYIFCMYSLAKPMFNGVFGREAHIVKVLKNYRK